MNVNFPARVTSKITGVLLLQKGASKKSEPILRPY